MLRITIDNRQIDMPRGATILDAAERLGIEIPSLCFLKECKPSASCLVCVVKDVATARLVPSCATEVVDGMVVESDTDAVRDARQTSLELLLSEHVGDCIAPCQFGCPTMMDIPRMLREIRTGDFGAAIATVKKDIALPAVLGRVCSAPCEKVCRRKDLDAAVEICRLKRLVADKDLASASPYSPDCKPDSGKRVAIVGAGPTGLAAAYYLAQHGHGVVVFDFQDKVGGRLRDFVSSGRLSEVVLDSEVTTIGCLGVAFVLKTRVGSYAELLKGAEVVLLASGSADVLAWGLEVGERGIKVDLKTFRTNKPGVFAAGNAIRRTGAIVRSVADGKFVAESIHSFLTNEEDFAGEKRPFSTKIGPMTHSELLQLAGQATESEADFGAGKCLRCDCRGLRDCKLRRYAVQYNANVSRCLSKRREFQIATWNGRLVFEPGKCIYCGLCVEIAAEAGEALGMAFVGRGFDIRVTVPFGKPLEESLTITAKRCVESCPTAALSIQD